MASSRGVNARRRPVGGRCISGGQAAGGRGGGPLVGSAKHPCVHEIRVSTPGSRWWGGLGNKLCQWEAAVKECNGSVAAATVAGHACRPPVLSRGLSLETPQLTPAERFKQCSRRPTSECSEPLPRSRAGPGPALGPRSVPCVIVLNGDTESRMQVHGAAPSRGDVFWGREGGGRLSMAIHSLF
ncbi:unnamed protein product [Boreogadus saida]